MTCRPACPHPPLRFVLASIFVLLAGSLSLAGCNSARTPTPDTDARMQPPTAVALGPIVSRSPTRARQTSEAPTATAGSEALELTWWLPEFMSPSAGGASGGLMSEFITQFEAAENGEVKITPVLKAKYGKGGLLDYLRTAHAVAPSVLPDIVALDLAEVEQAAELGLLQPLDPVLDSQLVAQLYPFARQAGEVSGRLMAIPFVADVEHLVYNRSQVTAAPANWQALLAAKTPYLLPAGSPEPGQGSGQPDDVQPVFISQYLSAKGSVEADTRQLVVEEEPLLRVLTFYSEGKRAGVLPPGMLDVSGLDETWTAYARGTITMTDVSARQFLIGQDTLSNAGFAPLPGWDKPAPPVARGWALAITATDPARQQKAAAFIAWLLAPQRAGAWAEAAQWLPVSAAAWQSWGNKPYYEFLHQQLTSAVAPPGGSDYERTAGQLRKALIAVLQDNTSPSQAAQAAVSQLAANK